MKAKVTHLNYSIGYYSAITERNKVVFTLVEPAAILVGDILEGDIENTGLRCVQNETRNTQIKIEVKELYGLNSPFKGHE